MLVNLFKCVTIQEQQYQVLHRTFLVNGLTDLDREHLQDLATKKSYRLEFGAQLNPNQLNDIIAELPAL